MKKFLSSICIVSTLFTLNACAREGSVKIAPENLAAPIVDAENEAESNFYKEVEKTSQEFYKQLYFSNVLNDTENKETEDVDIEKIKELIELYDNAKEEKEISEENKEIADNLIKKTTILETIDIAPLNEIEKYQIGLLPYKKQIEPIENNAEKENTSTISAENEISFTKENEESVEPTEEINVSPTVTKSVNDKVNEEEIVENSTTSETSTTKENEDEMNREDQIKIDIVLVSEYKGYAIVSKDDVHFIDTQSDKRIDETGDFQKYDLVLTKIGEENDSWKINYRKTIEGEGEKLLKEMEDSLSDYLATTEPTTLANIPTPTQEIRKPTEEKIEELEQENVVSAPENKQPEPKQNIEKREPECESERNPYINGYDEEYRKYAKNIIKKEGIYALDAVNINSSQLATINDMARQGDISHEDYYYMKEKNAAYCMGFVEEEKMPELKTREDIQRAFKEGAERKRQER